MLKLPARLMPLPAFWQGDRCLVRAGGAELNDRAAAQLTVVFTLMGVVACSVSRGEVGVAS